MNGKYPATLYEAYRLLSEIKQERVATSTTSSVFKTSSNQSPVKKKKDDAKGKDEFKGNCFLCDKVGHRASDCPLKPSTKTSYCATAEEVVEEALNFTTLCSTVEGITGGPKIFTSDADGIALEFTTYSSGLYRNKILLDNQAQRSIFGNKKLLEGIRRTSPMNFTGVGGKRVVSTKAGWFMSTVKVHHSPKCDVNILS